MESCGFKYKADLPFIKNLYAQVYCGVYQFKKRGETLLVCRHKQCYV